jgi:hypothetical protein
METEIRIRAFRATDDFETCLKFYEGHKRVLEGRGIGQVTSSTAEWMYSPSVFVVVVETTDCNKLYGGARVHAADGKKLFYRLKLQQATWTLPFMIMFVITRRTERVNCVVYGTLLKLQV